MVNVSVIPDKNAVLIFRFVVDELPDEDISMDVLDAVSVLAVVLELTLIETSEFIFVNEEALTVV